MTAPDTGGRLPEGTRTGRTALRVADLNGMVEFYRTVVGLAVHSRTETTAALGVDGDDLLHLEIAPEVGPRQRAETGLFHNAFRVPSRAALGDALERVESQWQLTGASDHLVSEALYLDDPEGNGVEIYRDFPREDWPYSEDGRVQLGTYHLDLEPIRAAATEAESMPPGSDLGHVHLEVSSLPATREFYVDQLGFEEMVSMPQATFVAAGGYHHHIGANTWNGRTMPGEGRGLAWFEVVVPDEAALAAVRQRLTDHGLSVTGIDDGFEVVDPDGIRVRLSVAT